jgi:uncharacterized protein (UPF0128 family)
VKSYQIERQRKELNLNKKLIIKIEMETSGKYNLKETRNAKQYILTKNFSKYRRKAEKKYKNTLYIQ